MGDSFIASIHNYWVHHVAEAFAAEEDISQQQRSPDELFSFEEFVRKEGKDRNESDAALSARGRPLLAERATG